MALSFPAGPTPGQQFVGDGVTYQYDSTRSAWVKLSPVQSALAGAAAQTGAAVIPGGDDTERAAITTPAAGMFRYNDTAAPAVMEYYDGTQWVDLATGGGGGGLGEWTFTSLPGNFVAYSETPVAYGNGIFIVAGGTGVAGSVKVSTSADGYTWTTPVTPASLSTWIAVSAAVYANNRFVIYGGALGSPQTATSTDGVNWTTGGVLAQPIQQLAGGNGSFVGVNGGVTNNVYYSSDGLNWSTAQVGTGSDSITALSYGTGNEFLVGSSTATFTYLYKSTDGGASWTQSAGAFSNAANIWFNSIVYDGTNYLVTRSARNDTIPSGGNVLGVYTTPDGTSPVGPVTVTTYPGGTTTGIKQTLVSLPGGGCTLFANAGGLIVPFPSQTTYDSFATSVTGAEGVGVNSGTFTGDYATDGKVIVCACWRPQNSRPNTVIATAKLP